MEFQFQIPHFGALYLATQADPDLDTLIEFVLCFKYNKLGF
jgi:hypothetical protein